MRASSESAALHPDLLCLSWLAACCQMAVSPSADYLSLAQEQVGCAPQQNTAHRSEMKKIFPQHRSDHDLGFRSLISGSSSYRRTIAPSYAREVPTSGLRVSPYRDAIPNRPARACLLRSVRWLPRTHVVSARHQSDVLKVSGSPMPARSGPQHLIKRTIRAGTGGPLECATRLSNRRRATATLQ